MPFVPVSDDEKKKWGKDQCFNSQHNPPPTIVLFPGVHVWKCPGCGHITRFEVPRIRCSV